MFRPLALVAALAGSISLSSAEINYKFEKGVLVSTDAFSDGSPDADQQSFQLASKSECFVLQLTSISLFLCFNSLTFSSVSSRCTRIKGLDALSLL